MKTQPLLFQDLQVSCYGCVGPIEEILNQHRDRLSITHYLVNVEKKTLRIWINAQDENERRRIDDEVRNLLKDKLSQEKTEIAVDSTPLKQRRRRRASPPPLPPTYHWLQAGIGLLYGGLLMGLMLLGLEPSGSLHWLHHVMIGSGMGIATIIGWPSIKNAYRGLTSRPRSMNMDVLFTLSFMGSFLLTLGHLLHLALPGGVLVPMAIDVALMLFGFRHLGQANEERLTPQIVDTQAFTDRARADHENFDDYEIGDVIEVKQGQNIPLNGVLVSETADLSFALFNGRPEPSTHEIDSVLYAGMIAHSDLKMQIKQDEENSYLQFRDNNLELARAHRAPIQDQNQKIINWFVPGTLVVAAGVGLMAGINLLGLNAALYILTSACPCVLGLITVMALKIGLTKLPPESGVTFNKAKGLEAAADIDYAVFDLNGTLTQNHKQVVGTPTVPEEFFYLIDAMEAEVDHPISTALRQYIKPRYPVYKFKFFHPDRNGITASDDKSTYTIGNAAFMNPPPDKIPTDIGNAQDIIYFAVNGIIQGHFLIEDPLRDDAALMLKNLEANGIEYEIHTGSDQRTAHVFADQLRISRSRMVADCTPESKFRSVQALQNADHKVAMFGDSGNDSDAIGIANLSVALISPATDPMVTQTADVSLNHRSLMPIIDILAVGRQTMKQIKQNLAISFSYNLLSFAYVPCAIFLKPSLLNYPFLGAAVMIVQSACVMGFALWMKNQEAKLPVQIDLDQDLGISEGQTASTTTKNVTTLQYDSLVHHQAAVVDSSTGVQQSPDEYSGGTPTDNKLV